jgi:DNA transformation protein
MTMATERDFVNYLMELLSPLVGITAKRMFGGYGLFRDGLMFGLVADATLYLKTDRQNQASFEERGLEPFTYRKADKVIQMSYCRAPEEALDSSEGMCAWAELAYQAALRAPKPIKPKRSRL